jgi:hypothetical protein
MVEPTHQALAPRFTIDAAAIDMIVERLGESIDTATVQTE